MRSQWLLVGALCSAIAPALAGGGDLLDAARAGDAAQVVKLARKDQVGLEESGRHDGPDVGHPP